MLCGWTRKGVGVKYVCVGSRRSHVESASSSLPFRAGHFLPIRSSPSLTSLSPTLAQQRRPKEDFNSKLITIRGSCECGISIHRSRSTSTLRARGV